MAIYTIATIGTKKDNKFFEIAKQYTEEMNLNPEDQINFVDITGKSEQEILSVGAIQGIMYFNDIHDVEIDDPSQNNVGTNSENHKNLDTFAYTLNLANKNSDKLSLFTLSHTAVTDKDMNKENQILQKYVDTPLRVESSPVNVSNLTDFKHYITGVVGLSASTHFNLANPLHHEVSEIVNEITDVSVNNLIDKSMINGQHEIRVANLAKAIAIQSKLFSPEEVESLFLSAKLHDIGKICIPDEVLAKPTALNYMERLQMDYHSAMGKSLLETIVANNPELAGKINDDVIKGVAFHHKDYNGLHNVRKKPEELTPEDYDPIRGDNIGKFALVIAVADCIDAMTAQRAYNNPKHIVDTFRDLWSNKDKQFKAEYAETGMLVLAKQIASLGIDAALLFEENSPRDFRHKDSEIKAFFEAHRNEYEVAKDVPEGAFSQLGFRLDEEGYFEFEGKNAPVRDPAIRFDDEFGFQKNKLKNEVRDGKRESITAEDIENARLGVIKKFEGQDLEGRQAIARARIRGREENSIGLATQIFQDVAENTVTFEEVDKSARAIIERQKEELQMQNPDKAVKKDENDGISL